MNNITSRKMGFLEKIATLFSEQAGGSTTISLMAKVDTLINFNTFQQAWHLLFQKQALLRTTSHITGNDYFFDFNAKLENIPIKHIETEDFAKVMQEFGDDIIRPLDFSTYYWRATLVTMKQTGCSYLMFGASHAICDGKSMSWLLGDLLRIIQSLDKGQTPQIEPLIIPRPFDELIDRTKFSPPAQPPEAPVEYIPFDAPTSLQSARTSNLLFTLEPNDCKALIKACQKHGTTITGALFAALTQSLLMQEFAKQELLLSTAFSLRPYTKEPMSDQLLAFYAHQLLFKLDLTKSNDFWSLAKQARENYQQAIREYTLASADDQAIFDGLTTSVKENIEQHRFFIPYTISNIGVGDAAFKELDAAYQVEELYGTVRNQGLFSLVIAAITIHDKLCLNLNFAAPALSETKAAAIVNGMKQALLNNLYT